MNTRISLLFAFLTFSVLAADVSNYKLDTEGPIIYSSWPPPTTQVNIYVIGPRVGPDDFYTFTWVLLHAGPKPTYSTTNSSEISSLMHPLYDQNDSQNKDKNLSNVSRTLGYTYHVLLFQDTNHTVMHFRVFEPFKPLEGKTNLCEVYPMSLTHTVYCNNKISSWLHARIKASGNTESSVGGTSTNQETNSTSGINRTTTNTTTNSSEPHQ